MKNLLTKYTTVVSLSIMTMGVACTNLDENLKDTYSKTPEITNKGLGIPSNVNNSQPNDGLQAAFNAILSGTATNGGFFAVQEGGTDEAVITQKGGDWYDGGLYIRMHQHEFTPQTWAINDCWNQAYVGIVNCNDILAGTPAPGAAQIAQLRFLRAYFYWRLLDVFGNVKIIPAGKKDGPQTPRAQVYNYIESELLAAIPDLPAGKQDYGRASKAGAYALLSRLYLNALIYTGTQQYQKAIDAADAVINSGAYSLATNYADVFAPENSQPKPGVPKSAPDEMIFVAPFDQSTGQGATWPHMTLHYPSQLTYKLTAQPWNGFSTLEDFYNSYDDTDKRKAANFIVGQQYAADGTTPLLDLAFTKGYPNGANLNYTPQINELYPNAWRAGGARFGKFAIKTFQGTNSDNDYPILRFGEVLLNKAEALQRLNNNWSDPTALALVNQLRTRAGTTVFTTMTQNDMLAERGREMFIESVRRTDMIRFGTYISGTWWEHTVADGNANRILMPIPIEQMQQNGTKLPDGTPLQLLTQNPGY